MADNSKALARRPAQSPARQRDGGKAADAGANKGPNRGQFFLAMAALTLLAVGTGFAMAYAVQERIEAMRAQIVLAPPAEPMRFAGETALQRLSPVVTNLVEPADAWVRVDLALVMDRLEEEERSRLTAEIASDVLAYMRTLTLAQIEGASGLQFLREDLSERAATRSQGRVREVVLETMVVQ
jgi:flagellar protein FliL